MSQASADFVHLHVHTAYSLLDGAIRVGKLMSRVKELGMSAVAMTDHGNLYGAVDFYQSAQQAGIKPILGCEVYLAPAERTLMKAVPGRKNYSHLTLLAENNTGWANLVKLVSRAHLEGVFEKPRVDKETLHEFREGIICLSGDINGEINEFLLSDRYEEAKTSAAWFLETYGPDNFFLELQDHGLDSQARSLEGMLQLSQELGIQLVATNDAHFLTSSDSEGHDVMVCIGEGQQVDTENRLKYSPEVYLKSPEAMRRLFADHPEACENTVRIAERCDVTLDLDAKSIAKYPKFQSPDGSPLGEYFRRLCLEGLAERYGEQRAKEDKSLLERLNYEIDLMEKLGFLSYFLIVWDFIKWARDNDIPVGPGRGSAAGSLVAYSLRITDICPLRFNLIFERFLNPDRVSPPDVDIDFCQNRRGEVIDYVRKKYGERQVAHIITFGTMGAKSVIRDVGRVLGIGYSEADRIAKMIPNELGITLNWNKKKNKPGAIDLNPELAAEVRDNPTVTRLWEFASYLEGLSRNAGVHAAGVVIADKPLDDFVPLTRGNEGEVVTQYSMGAITEAGLLKMDFLGLRNLTVIDDAVKLIRRREPDFELDDISYEDVTTFEMLKRGETKAVFQMESEGMAQTCRQLKPDKIEEIIALIALYRPGPMQFIDSFTRRKNGLESTVQLHPLLDEIGRETYGILIYQEQVQQAASVLAGYTLGQADLLRRAMGKKKKEEMDEQRVFFVKGCVELNGFEEKQANAIFDVLEKFAEYGFNKSHSAAYGIVTYQTAFLKANYPVEFLSAVLSNEAGNTDKIGFFINECRRMGIRMLPPDVNLSGLNFLPAETGGGMAIRFGLGAIKNVGAKAMESLIEEREANGPFESMEDCVRRVDTRFLNRKVLESLVKCGAFDFTKEPRHQLMSRVGSAIDSAASVQRDQRSGQGNLFDSFDFGSPPAAVAVEEEIPAWSDKERLDFEKELIGFYVSGHPLDAFEAQITVDKIIPLAELVSTTERRGDFAGLLSMVSVKYSKKDNRPFATMLLEDFSGSTEVVAWSDCYEECGAAIRNGNVVKIRARIDVDQKTEMKRLTLDKVETLQPDTARQKTALQNRKAKERAKAAETPVEIPEALKPKAFPPGSNRRLVFDAAKDSPSDLRSVHQFLSENPGQVDIDFLIRRGPLELLIPNAMRIELNPVVRAHLRYRLLTPST